MRFSLQLFRRLLKDIPVFPSVMVKVGRCKEVWTDKNNVQTASLVFHENAGLDTGEDNKLLAADGCNYTLRTIQLFLYWTNTRVSFVFLLHRVSDIFINL